MPELPEVETIARDLDRALGGARITGVSVTRPDVLREVTARTLARRTTGATIERVWRRAKHAVIDLSTGDRLVVQPRFTGALLIDDGALPEEERLYSTLAFELADGRTLHYRDIRRLGTVALMAPGRWAEYSGKMGIEPLDPAFTTEYLWGALHGSTQAVKKLLMDQSRVVGIGNIYANEALWRAGIDPSRQGRALLPDEVERLHDVIVPLLEEAIEARGTSFRDYRDARGERGSFAALLQVYGREGLPCVTCGARLVGTHAVDGRATVFCAYCQR
ncbi:MAG TPA: bifunctional DNA-formamidopyrimidine glycosylase/DNA-(apurinic or apyrimidinic site) lyase [Gemmatimonadaceae bacterium]